MDYQTGIIAIVQDEKTNFYQVQTMDQIYFDNSLVDDLKDAWVVVTLENQKERRELSQVKELLHKSKRIVISSGHIYWLRLAMGFIDAYLDPIGGEALYEMFACTVAQKAGCIVTDLRGETFDAFLFEKI